MKESTAISDMEYPKFFSKKTSLNLMQLAYFATTPPPTIRTRDSGGRKFSVLYLLQGRAFVTIKALISLYTR